MFRARYEYFLEDEFQGYGTIQYCKTACIMPFLTKGGGRGRKDYK